MYKLAETYIAEENGVNITKYKNKEVTVAEGCIAVKFPVTEELTLNNTKSNAFYVA